MTPAEKRAYLRGFHTARLMMSRQLRRTKAQFDSDIEELKFALEDIAADITDMTVDAGVNADQVEVVLH